MNENWVSFDEVKKAVSMVMVLDRYGVKLRRVNATALRGACPVPSHTSKETNNSFGVDTKKNAWSCQSKSCGEARGRRGGNVLDFVAAMESCSIRDAALKLQDWFAVGEGSEQQKKNAPAATPPSIEKTGELVAKEETSDTSDNGNQENPPLTFTLKDVDPVHLYLTDRGITSETARVFGVGFFPGKGSMTGRIVIPIRNVGGELVAYAGRSIDGTEPKYKLPAGFKKSLELYNLDRVIHLDDDRRVILVEGFFDVMKVHQSGFKRVVGLMGSSLSDAQERLLTTHFDKVFVMLDGDAAGRSGTQDIVSRLAAKLWVRVACLPDGVQPDAMTTTDIRTTVLKTLVNAA